jgi:aspartyl protease family protein
LRECSIAFLVLAALFAAGLLVLFLLNPSVAESEAGIMRIVYAVALLLIIGPVIFADRLSGNLRNLTIWTGIIGVVALGYAVWQQRSFVPERSRAELNPRRSVSSSPSEASIVANDGGDFVVEAFVDGTSVIFVVDTGASDVILSLTDAERVGLDPDSLSYTRAHTTANGTIFGAPIRLESISIGPIAVENVRASISQTDLSTSLLGMSFLKRLDGFSVRGRTMTIYQ